MAPAVAPTPYVPSEFERYVQRLDPGARRFGVNMMVADGAATAPSGIVPPDYALGPGDEVVVTLWGSVDADLRLVIDRTGRVSIPRVGTVMLAGVRYAELQDVLARRVGQVFKNFQIAVGLGQLRSIRFYVTGFVARPGTFTLSALSSVVQGIMAAGGPSASGSFRSIELRRQGRPPVIMDLYDLLLRGDRGADRLLQAEDVIHVQPAGRQVAVVGSVQQPGVFEVREGETLGDVLQMAGGLSAVADRGRIAVQRFGDRNLQRVNQLPLPDGLTERPGNGDIVFAFSGVDSTLPTQRQNKRVRVEGEVARPGDYILQPESTLRDAVAAAGGLTREAFLFGTEFTRQSVRTSQEAAFDRALRDLELDFNRANAQRRGTSEDGSQQAARQASSERLLERLRAARPSGRVVLQLPLEASELPALALEDGDRITIPPRPTTVGVFGSVFNPGSYLFDGARTLDDYVRLAGGTTRSADGDSIFVVRASGEVVGSAIRNGGWFSRSSSAQRAPALPGDTVYVPEDFERTTWTAIAKDWTQILYQFGLGAAGLQVLSK